MLFKNELLWLLLIAVNFGIVILAYRLFGKLGLYAWIGVAIIIANIQVLKTVELFTMVATLGNIIYGTTFLTTDILSEVYGKAAAKKAVFILSAWSRNEQPPSWKIKALSYISRSLVTNAPPSPQVIILKWL